MIRVGSFLVVLIVAATGPWWLLVGLGIGYACYFTGVELLLLAVLIDAFFLPTHALIPQYTVGTIALLMLVVSVKPHLLFYNHS